MSRHHHHLDRKRWERTRQAVFERDGHRCVMCGRAGRLECDHVTPLEREPGQDVYDWNGLQSLCKNCHVIKTRAESRNPLSPDEVAWRSLIADRMGNR